MNDIQHVSEKNNVVADALSRVGAMACPTMDYKALARDQQSQEVQAYRTAITNLRLEDVKFQGSTVLCDTLTDKPRPVVPAVCTRQIFDLVHGLSHPGVKPTKQAISTRFVWHGKNKDIQQWCWVCHAYQASKIHRHTCAALVKRIPPGAHFSSLHVDLVGPLPMSEGMVIVHDHRPFYTLARGNSCSRCKDLYGNQGFHKELGCSIQCAQRHHLQQRTSIHFVNLVRSPLHPWH